MNLPNLITLSRIALSGLFMWCLLSIGLTAKILALIVFLIACATDWLDGRLARSRHQLTAFGALMDPIADKILVLSALVAFVQLRLIPAWMVIVILGRELLITGVRLLVNSGGRVLPAMALGKYKTSWQMFAIVTITSLQIVHEAAPRWNPHSPIATETWIMHTSYAVMLVAVCLTLISGLQFLWVHRTLLRNGPTA